MPDARQRGGGDEREQREIYLTKIAGSAAAFILLVMWMTPPTTPHPVAPPTLDAFKTIRSDAPTKDPLAAPGDFSRLAAIPWFDLRMPKLPHIPDEVIEGPAIVWPDEPAPPQASAAVEPPEPAAIVEPPLPSIEPAGPVARPGNEQPRQAWARADSRAFEDRADAPLEDEQ